MKQTSFVVEVVLTDTKPTIIIREPSRGMVVKVTSDPKEVETFLCEVLKNLEVSASPVPSNSSSHE